MVRIRNVLSKIYVSNIPWTISSKELRQYFNGFGSVSQATVVFDRETGMSKKYGFVTFVSEDTAVAVQKVSRHMIEGQTLIIQPLK